MTYNSVDQESLYDSVGHQESLYDSVFLEGHKGSLYDPVSVYKAVGRTRYMAPFGPI